MAYAKANIKKEADELLRQFIEASLGIGITLTKGAIEHEDVEAIACAVDNSLNLAASGSAAESLLSAGGESLQTECKKRFPSGIKYGDVIVLGRGKLKCKKVFLTSMPDFEDEDEQVDFKTSEVLSDTVSAILDNAIQKRVKTIAIPAVGIGKLGLSAENAASIYYDYIKNKKAAFGSLRNITFVLNDKPVFEEFKRQLFTIQGFKEVTFLHWACRFGVTEIFQYIVDSYPSLVNIRDSGGSHILHYTILSGSVECLQWVTDKVIPDKDKQHREQYMLQCLNNDGRTILHVACLNGKTEMCRYIIDNYPSLVHVKDNIGRHILHDTAMSGRIECFKRITDIVIPDKDKQHKEQYMLQCLNNDGRTILHVACLNGKTQMCQFIVDNYPSLVHVKDNFGCHIIHDAAMSGSIECFKRITDIVIPGKDKKHREQYMLKCLNNVGKTILHLASFNGKTEMCQYIVDNYPSLVNVKDNIGCPILHHTAMSGNIEWFKRMTDIVIPGKDKKHREQYMLQCLNNYGKTILHAACANGKAEMCQYIIDNYPSLINVKDNIGCHILHHTAISGSIECFERITDIVIADKDKKHREQYMLQCLNDKGKTILHAACLNGKAELCQYIVDNYPSLLHVNDNIGCHILHETAVSGSIECFKWITDIILPDKTKQHREQYMLQCLDNAGKTILHWACCNGKTYMCQYVVDNYPSLVHVKDNTGCHILHDTAMSGNIECLQRIADIVIPDKDKQSREKYMLKCLNDDGKTILHAACFSGKTGMCQFIVDNYPSLLHVKDEIGCHILHDVVMSGSIECFQRITDIVIPNKDKQHREQYMLQCLDNDGKTILHSACSNGKTEMCQYLLDNYPRLIKVRDNNGFHILHVTAESGTVDCLQGITDKVLQNKDNQQRERYMKCLTNDGRTILHCSYLNQTAEMCQYILDNYPSLIKVRDHEGMHFLYYMAMLGRVDFLSRLQK